MVEALLTRDVLVFLQKPLIARMTTIGPDGYPHTVPVWFDVDGGDLVVISVRGTRKARHILDNPKGAITIGGDSTDGAGYMVQGDFVIEEDPGQTWTHRLIDRYEEGEQAEKDKAEWAELDLVVIRLKSRRLIKVM